MKVSRLLFLAPFLLAACVGAPRIMSYYVDRGVMQYYLMPTDLVGKDSTVSMDFTIRVGAAASAPATCNFTLSAPHGLPRGIQRARLALNDRGREIELHDIGVLYVENAAHRLRITSTVDGEDFRELLRSRDMRLLHDDEAGEHTFVPGRAFYAALKDAAVEIIDEAP